MSDDDEFSKCLTRFSQGSQIALINLPLTFPDFSEAKYAHNAAPLLNGAPPSLFCFSAYS